MEIRELPREEWPAQLSKIPPREEAPSDLAEVELVVWNMLEKPKAQDEIVCAAVGSAQADDISTASVALELRDFIREKFGAWHRL